MTFLEPTEWDLIIGGVLCLHAVLLILALVVVGRSKVKLSTRDFIGVLLGAFLIPVLGPALTIYLMRRGSGPHRQ